MEKISRKAAWYYDNDLDDDINGDGENDVKIQEYSWDDDYEQYKASEEAFAEKAKNAAEREELIKKQETTRNKKKRLPPQKQQQQQEENIQIQQQQQQQQKENSSSSSTPSLSSSTSLCPPCWKSMCYNKLLARMLIVVVIGTVAIFGTDYIIEMNLTTNTATTYTSSSSSSSSSSFGAANINDVVSDISWKDKYKSAIDHEALNTRAKQQQIDNINNQGTGTGGESNNEERSSSSNNNNNNGSGGGGGVVIEESSGVKTAAVIPHGFEKRGGRYTYHRRGKPMTEEQRDDIKEEWGSWEFVDEKRDERPMDDYYSKYPNRDIPRTEFPNNNNNKAWQIDEGYLSRFLPEGIALVERAQKAILVEYGQYNETTENTNNDDVNMMFYLHKLDNLTTYADKRKIQKSCNDCHQKGGWTTKSSWEGLKRRILHAIMTEDNFVFAMGGHSAAAGHGNHFQQSYTLQVQRILEPVLARLGVRHQSRNFGNGGLGTVHNTIAASSIYGPDVDVLMWDSSMTEKEDKAKSLFVRQALMGGIKVPVMWLNTNAAEASISHYNNASGLIDVGCPGDGKFAIQKAREFDDFKDMPWATRYMKCSNDLNSICKRNEYNGTCWIDRPDGFVPEKGQKNALGGRASWHPGWRKHQIVGRILAYTFLQAIKEALIMWNEAEEYALADDVWHVTSYYENMREAAMAIHPDVSKCSKFDLAGLGFLCQYPMKGRTMFTPRAYPSLTTMENLFPPGMASNVPMKRQGLAYSPPDVYNPHINPPPGEIDVLSIIESGTEFRSTLNPDYAESYYKKPKFDRTLSVDEYGKGWNPDIHGIDDYCDGSYDSFCNRNRGTDCMLYGHNDGRKGYLFDSYSGWMVMNIPDLKNGFIVVRLETWHNPDKVGLTTNWTSINDADKIRRRRELKKNQKLPLCNNFLLDFSIDGAVTSVNKTEFSSLAEKGHIQRVVETFVLLADPTYTGGEEKEVEVAIRMRNCAQKTTFKLSHIYWS